MKYFGSVAIGLLIFLAGCTSGIGDENDIMQDLGEGAQGIHLCHFPETVGDYEQTYFGAFGGDKKNAFPDLYPNLVADIEIIYSRKVDRTKRLDIEGLDVEILPRKEEVYIVLMEFETKEDGAKRFEIEEELAEQWDAIIEEYEEYLPKDCEISDIKGKCQTIGVLGTTHLMFYWQIKGVYT